MNPVWLLRAKRWVQNPPSTARVRLVFVLVALALGVVALEYFGLWPEWARAELIPRGL